MSSRFHFHILIVVLFLLLVPSTRVEAQWWNPWAPAPKPAPRAQPRTPVRAPPPPRCLAGETRSATGWFIEQQIQNPHPGSHVAFWRNPVTQHDFVNSCRNEFIGHPLDRTKITTAENMVGLGQFHMSRSCIRAAIVSRANGNISVDRTICAPNERITTATPCLTDGYVGYIHFTINSALRCMSAPGNEIDPDLIFGMINNESAFMGFVQSPGGVGLMQMTSIAAREVFAPGQAGREHLDTMMARPRKKPFCDQFRNLIINDPGRSVNNCSWLGAENGFARNIIAGVALISYYQKSMKDIVATAGVPRTHPRFQDIVEQFSLVAYNAGMTQAKLLLSKLGGRNIARQADPVAYVRSNATTRIGNDYLAMIRTRRGEIQGLPRHCWEAP